MYESLKLRKQTVRFKKRNLSCSLNENWKLNLQVCSLVVLETLQGSSESGFHCEPKYSKPLLLFSLLKTHPEKSFEVSRSSGS